MLMISFFAASINKRAELIAEMYPVLSSHLNLELSQSWTEDVLYRFWGNFASSPEGIFHLYITITGLLLASFPLGTLLASSFNQQAA